MWEVIRDGEWWPVYRKGKSKEEEDVAGCGEVKSGNFFLKKSLKISKIKKVSCTKGILLEYLIYFLNWASWHCKDKNRDNTMIGVFATGATYEVFEWE